MRRFLPELLRGGADAPSFTPPRPPSRPLHRPLLWTLCTLAAMPAAVHAYAAAPCPSELPAGTRCEAGRDARGAYYWTAIPAAWNGVLVVHSHGGPSLKAPAPDDAREDLVRFAVVVGEGYAWTGSSYRHAGYGVRDAAEDTDSARAIFWRDHGRPRRTLLHGQSWGGNVAARTAELHARDGAGRLNYDGVVLTNGVMAGGTRSYDFRADLRAVYQYYCNNLPAPNEPAYPLWQGLPPAGTPGAIGNAEIEKRINACTGVHLAPGERSARQSEALRNITQVLRIRDSALVSHMNWASGMFRDLTQRFLKGKNPFGNIGVAYTGSNDDAALNAGVARFAADPAAVAELAWDSDIGGKLQVPTLSIHAIGDPTAFVELEAAFAGKVTAAGAGEMLLQVYTDEHEHRKLATPQYAAVFASMLAWIEQGKRPDVRAVMRACESAAPRYGEACKIDPGYAPPPLNSRVYPRSKP